MDFITIDFETANETRASACSCGIAVVSDGKIAETRHWLIQPQELRFNPRNTRLHKIDASTVADAPRLCDLWDKILPYIDGQLVLAHNARFDFDVLRKTLDAYGIEYPQLEYSCTYLIAKETWRDWVCFKLAAIAIKLNLSFRHHNAEDDAMACAYVALAAMKHLGARTFEELEEATSVYRGRLEHARYCVPSSPRVRGEKRERPALRYVCPDGVEVDPSNPFYHRVIVFTGTVAGFSKGDGKAIVESYGGTFKRGVCRKTNFVVVGEFDPNTLREGAIKSDNLVYAEELAADGYDIEIIDGTDFERMLSG